MGRLILLGTGGSMGIPVVTCECDVCKSTSPYNKRLRPSALIQMGDKTILIDSGPDFRMQALRYDLKHLDGVLITHAHHDHTAGIDELRVFYIAAKKTLPCLMSKETYEDLKVRFAYLFVEDAPKHQLISRLDIQLLPEERGMIDFAGEKIQYLSYEQAGMKVNGFRFGDLAYISDISKYPETIFKDLEGINYLIVSALRFVPSPLHFSIDEAVEFATKLNVKKAWLTHLSHAIDHEKAEALLPKNVRLAYDGLEIPFDEHFSQ